MHTLNIFQVMSQNATWCTAHPYKLFMFLITNFLSLQTFMQVGTAFSNQWLIVKHVPYSIQLDTSFLNQWLFLANIHQLLYQ
jgi:hypothetical protein